MERLIIIENGEERVYSISSRVVTLGRSSKNDIVIKDANASRKHCNVLRVGDAWFVVDCDSQNGTYVNDEKIKKKELEEGDKINVGSTEIYFLIAKDTREIKDKKKVAEQALEQKKYEQALEEYQQASEDFESQAKATDPLQQLQTEPAMVKAPAPPQQAAESQEIADDTHEAALDKLLKSDKQLQEELDRISAAESEKLQVEPKPKEETEPRTARLKAMDRARQAAPSVDYEDGDLQASLKTMPMQKQKRGRVASPTSKNKVIPPAQQILPRIKQCYEQLQKQVALDLPGQENVVKLLFVALLARGHCLLQSVDGLIWPVYRLLDRMAYCLGLSFKTVFSCSGKINSAATGRYNLLLLDNCGKENSVPISFLCENVADFSLARQRLQSSPPHMIVMHSSLCAKSKAVIPEALQPFFMFNLHLNSFAPSPQQEIAIIESALDPQEFAAIASESEIGLWQTMLQDIAVAPQITEQTVELIRATRPDGSESGQYIERGIDTYAGVLLLKAARALAALHGVSQLEMKQVEIVAQYFIPPRLSLKNDDGNPRTVYNIIQNKYRQKQAMLSPSPEKPEKMLRRSRSGEAKTVRHAKEDLLDGEAPSSIVDASAAIDDSGISAGSTDKPANSPVVGNNGEKLVSGE